MADTVESLQLELAQIETAYADYLVNGQTTKLVIGVGESRREYGFTEIDIEFFTRERARLRKELLNLQEVPVVFRKSSFMRAGWGKL